MTPNQSSRMLASQIERTGHILSTTADYAARRIYLFGDIEDNAAYRLTVALHIMDATPGEIQLFLNTGGGHIESGFAIYDAIRFCRNPVTVIGFGAVMSMGAIIMQAGDTRLMAPYARMMIHTGNVGLGDDVDSDKLISIGHELEGIRERFISLLQERSGLSIGTITAMVKNETYFSAHEAVQNGLADGVVLMPEKLGTEKISAKRPKKATARKRKR